MAISLTHTTQAAGTDAGNGEIGKTQWNENHTLTMAGGGTVLGRATSGDGAVEELTELTLASGTKTASAPMLDMTQTWNSSGATFTGWKLNITNTASAADSLLMDLRVNNSSLFSVSKEGNIKVGSGFAPLAVDIISSSGIPSIGLNGNAALGIATIGSARHPTAIQYGLGSTATITPDVFLSRRAAANIRLGRADAAAPVAQTLSVQSVVAGTSNTAGADLTITGSQGTGTGAGGDFIVQIAPAGTSGTSQNALAQAFRVHNTKTVTAGAAFTVATLPTAGVQGRRAWVTDATAPTFLGTLTGGGSVVCPVFDNGTAWVAG